MLGTAGLGLILADRQDHPSLASIGAAAGLATPFLLSQGPVGSAALVVYTILILCWIGGLYLRRGWVSLLWTAASGGLSALALAADRADTGERPAAQAGLVLAWVIIALLPYVREGLRSHAPERWPASTLREIRRFVAWGVETATVAQLRVLGFGGTALVLLISAGMWELSESDAGCAFVASAGAFGTLALWARPRAGWLVRSAAGVGGLLLVTGALLLFRDPLRLVGLAALAAALVVLGPPLRGAGLTRIGHALFAVLALELVASALAEGEAGPSFGLDAWVHLVGIGLAVAASRAVRSRKARTIYLVGAHLAFLLWLYTEITPLPNGAGLTTLVWGVWASALLIVALRARRNAPSGMVGLQVTAVATLGLVVAKLLAVDLTRLEVTWRILLFMGFGIGLLALSSLFRSGARIEPR